MILVAVALLRRQLLLFTWWLISTRCNEHVQSLQCPKYVYAFALNPPPTIATTMTSVNTCVALHKVET